MPNLSQITLLHRRWIIAKDHILGITNSKDEHKYSMFQPWNCHQTKEYSTYLEELINKIMYANSIIYLLFEALQNILVIMQIYR